jgi:hypothetical protein
MMRHSGRLIAVSSFILFLIVNSFALSHRLFSIPNPSAQDPRAKIRKDRLEAGLLILDASGSYSTPDIAQGRNLNLYNRLGPIDGGHNFEIRDEERQNAFRALSQAREFLWTNWKAPSRAYLILNLHSVDATNTSHIFIEPDDSGRWRVIWRIVRYWGALDDREASYSVEKEIVENASESIDYPFGAKEILVFRSASGKVIDRF